jgi:hypothetical protein
MTPLRFTILLSVFLVSVSQAADDNKKTAPLFTNNDLLEVTVRGPFTTIMRVRSRDEDSPGTLTYHDSEAGDVTVELGIRTRGRYRHQSDICPWAPLRLNFKKSSVKGTLFAGSNKLKLVTHCRNNASRYTQGVFSEYLAYRIFNQITDNSFRVRLMRVTYVDTDKGNRERTEFGFLIEHRNQVAKRIGLPVNSVESIEVSRLDGAQLNLASVFQYLIANTDFSPIRAATGESCCHNNVLFGDQAGQVQTVPYDFDMSGIVDARYATPNPKFQLRSVQERLYRGRCVNNKYLDASRQAFIDQKQAIYDFVENNEYFNNGTRKQTVRFINKFYAIIENPKKFEARLAKECVS